jgi:DNA-binding NtrC family response regulator
MEPRAPRCGAPFDGGSGLCDSCRLPLPGEGLRRCRRMIAESAAMRALLGRAGSVAAADGPVVLLGETGSGKEVLARALHASSPRAAGPLVAVNCGAIPAELLESELFGHARGAFSGAVAEKRGLFHEAHRGSILLDEIADLPLLLQVKLLRVLQDGEVRRVGETATARVDVRVLAATHRDLRADVAVGRFREDLYFRLKVFSLTLPPLRERAEDVLPLARHFLEREARRATRLGPEAERILLAYRWPGNCRELENAVRHAAALADGDEVRPEHLPDELRAAPPPATVAPGRLAPLAEVEREHVLAVLEACRGRQAEAARVLGIGRNTLWRKLEGWRRDGAI